MPEAQFGLAKICLGRGKYQQALVFVDQALRLGSEAQSAHYLRGRILSKLGRREEARKEMLAASQMGNAGKGRELDAFDANRVPNPELAEPPE